MYVLFGASWDPCQLDVLAWGWFSGWCYAEEGLLIGGEGRMTDTHGLNYEELVLGGNRLLLSMCERILLL